MGGDASKEEYGAKHWILERFTEDWRTLFEDKKIGITTLELYKVYAPIRVFG